MRSEPRVLETRKVESFLEVQAAVSEHSCAPLSEARISKTTRSKKNPRVGSGMWVETTQLCSIFLSTLKVRVFFWMFFVHHHCWRWSCCGTLFMLRATSETWARCLHASFDFLLCPGLFSKLISQEPKSSSQNRVILDWLMRFSQTFFEWFFECWSIGVSGSLNWW